MERARFSLDDLKLMKADVIPNVWAAEVLRMDPNRLAEYARTGKLKWNTIISGNRVKHVRRSLIRFLEGEFDE